jgi:hypothetical protein
MPLILGDSEEVVGCFSATYLRQLLSDLTGVGLLLEALELRLWTAGPDPHPGQELADFTEPTFTGYAKKTALAWGDALWEGGKASIMSMDPVPTFTCTAAPDPAQVVLGYLLTIANGPGFDVVLAERIDPVTISEIGNFVTVVPRIVLGSAF